MTFLATTNIIIMTMTLALINADTPISLIGLKVRQSGTYSTNLAEYGVDGNNSTCSIACTTCPGNSPENEMLAWFQIDLQDFYEVHSVALISNRDFTNAQYLNNFVLLLRNNNSTMDPTSDDDNDICNKYINQQVPTYQLIQLNCTRTSQGRYLTFKRQQSIRSDAFSTCEVFAWGKKVERPIEEVTLPINTTKDDQGNGGFSREEIIGISLGAIFGCFILMIIIAVVVYIYCLRKSKIPDDKIKVCQQNSDPESIIVATASSSNQSSVKADDFYHHVKLLRDSNSKNYLHYFKKFPEDEIYETSTATNSINQCKNRFKNVLPYDYNRVIIDEGLSSDYINASRIKGLNGQEKYIATQDPMDVTIVDFWSMIWQNKVTKIISLSIFSRFWPEIKKTYGLVTVTMVTEEKYSNYSKRLFALDTQGESLEVIQFQYLEVDFLITPFRFLSFVNIIRSSGKDNELVVVQCSGGIGLTGCYIAVDYLLDELESHDQINVITCVERLRHQRMNSVQTLEQFSFIHDVLLEKIQVGRMVLTWPKMVEKLERIMKLKTRGELKLDKRYQVLEELIHHHLGRHGSGSLVNHTDVYVNSYKKKNAYWLKKVPDASEFDEFWKSMFDLNVDLCVAIGANIKNFWPIELNAEHNYDLIGVTCKEMIFSMSDVIKTSRYQIRSHVDNEVHSLTFIHLDYNLPSTPNDPFYDNVGAAHLVDLYNQISKNNYPSNSPISFVCRDGITHCGTLATAFYLLDVLKIERIADVTGACRHVTSFHPRAITSATQYKFLHQVLLNFLRKNIKNKQSSDIIGDDDDVNIVIFDPIGSSFI